MQLPEKTITICIDYLFDSVFQGADSRMKATMEIMIWFFTRNHNEELCNKFGY